MNFFLAVENRYRIILSSTILCVVISAVSGQLLFGQPLQPAALGNDVSLLLDSPSLDLNLLLNLALDNSPQVKAALEEWKALQQRQTQAGVLPDPRLTYGYFIESVQTKTGPQKQRLGIAQAFPSGGKRGLAREMASREAQVAEQTLIQTRLDLHGKLRKLYWDYLFLHGSRALTSEHLEILKTMESLAMIRFQTGALSQNALIHLQLRLSSMEESLNRLNDLTAPMSQAILAAAGLLGKAEALGRGEGVAILPAPVQPDQTSDSGMADLSRDFLISRLKEFNPRIIGAALIKDRAIAARGLAARRSQPDFTLGLEMVDVEGGKDPFAATISLNLPLHHRANRAALREASHRVQGSMARQNSLEQELIAALDMELFNYRDARRKVALYGETLIPRAKQALQVVLKSLETGAMEMTQVLDAQQDLLELQLALAGHQRDLQKSLAGIMALTGATRPGELHQAKP